MAAEPSRFRRARPFGGRSVAIVALLFLMILLAVAGPDASSADAESPGETTLSVRLVMDQDSCPALAEVWLDLVHDTVAAFELYLSWDRPDFAQFETALVAPDTTTPAPLGVPPNPMRQPVFLPDSMSLSDWEYKEARGESGLWVKITAFSYLTRSSPARLITPGSNIRLLGLPLVAARPPRDFLPGDVALIRFDPGRTRLSRPDGQLVESFHVIDDSTRVSACKRQTDPEAVSPQEKR